MSDVRLFADNILGPGSSSIFREAYEYWIANLESRYFLANFLNNTSGIVANAIRKAVVSQLAYEAT